MFRSAAFPRLPAIFHCSWLAPARMSPAPNKYRCWVRLARNQFLRRTRADLLGWRGGYACVLCEAWIFSWQRAFEHWSSTDLPGISLDREAGGFVIRKP